jgi:Zn-dependent alcohol dehydrogenase
MIQTQAAVLHAGQRQFSIETLELAPPRSGEVLVKVGAAGVCHSDYHLLSGATQHPMPVVAGHEGAGIVVEVGENVDRVKVGDQVALNWAPNCGDCFYCHRDRPSLCQTYLEPIWAGTMLDGSTRWSLNGEPVYHFSAVGCFSEYLVCPDICCVPLPREIPAEIAALIGCAVTTGVGAVMNTAGVEAGSSVVVYGAGGVGLSVVLGAKLAGASSIIVVDNQEAKGDMALEFGASDFLLSHPENIQSIQALTAGRGADYVFEAVGLPALQEEALGAARPGGTLVLAGLSPMGSGTNLPGALITRQEKTVVGSYYGTANTARDFPKYADLYQRGLLDLDRLISKRFELDEINAAYDEMLSGETARGLIVFKS